MTDNVVVKEFDPRSINTVLLHYLADQLRCYANDIEINDGVLPTFADLLDHVAFDLEPSRRRE